METTNTTPDAISGGSPARARRLESQTAYRYLDYWLIGLLLIMITGFWIPYLSSFPRFDPHIPPAVHIHAALLFFWVALLVIQPLAVRRGAFATHRFLGRTSYVLMPLIALFAVAMLRLEYSEQVRSGTTVRAAIVAEYLSGAQLVLLVVLYGLAIRSILRRDVSPALIDLGLLALIAYDRNRQQQAQPFVATLVAYVVLEVVWLALGRPV
jgi:hypothetical protein